MPKRQVEKTMKILGFNGSEHHHKTESLSASTGQCEEGEEPIRSFLIPVFIGSATEESLCYTKQEIHHRDKKDCAHNTQTCNEKYYMIRSRNFSPHLLFTHPQKAI